MYDAVVVGARCAGASLAMLLARRGYRVALVDRATFPSDTMSTHFLWQRGGARLEAWGLLERLRNRGCEPIRTITYDVGPVALRGLGPAVGGISDTFCPRRTVLDQLLVEAAVEAGAELFEGVSVRSLTWTDEGVSGIEAAPHHRPAFRLRGRVVVGADGLHSRVARAVGSETYCAQPPLTCVYYSYWSGIADRRAAFYARPRRLILKWPTNDDLTCIYIGWPRAEFGSLKTDLEGNFLRTLELVPGLRDMVEAGRREERFAGTGDLPNMYRRSHGAGWALAGDAGHHKDPTTGMGMSDAFASADLLSDALHDALAGERSWEDALQHYEGRRDEATANGFRLTLGAAALSPVPLHVLKFYELASARPALTERIFGVLGGSIRIEHVYSRERMAEVMGANAN
jgi:flavin-dependent dehydrogenase